MTDPFIYVLAVATILGTPGPTNTLMATAGATQGIARSLNLLIGELSGYLLAISIIRVVLGPVVATVPAIGIALKVIVAIYLVWLAIKVWRSAGTLTVDRAPVTLLDVFITTLFNPKALIFALTVIPAEHPALHWYLIGFAGLVIVAGGSWIVIGRVLTIAAGRHAHIVPRAASVVLVGFAAFILRSAV